jgi:hypothetical protein
MVNAQQILVPVAQIRFQARKRYDLPAGRVGSTGSPQWNQLDCPQTTGGLIGRQPHPAESALADGPYQLIIRHLWRFLLISHQNSFYFSICVAKPQAIFSSLISHP